MRELEFAKGMAKILRAHPLLVITWEEYAARLKINSRVYRPGIRRMLAEMSPPILLGWGPAGVFWARTPVQVRSFERIWELRIRRYREAMEIIAISKGGKARKMRCLPETHELLALPKGKG